MHKKLKNLLKAEIDPAFAKRAEYIFTKIEEQKPKRILDIGCGRGFYVQALTMYDFPKEIHGIDVKEEYLKVLRKKIKDKRVTIKQNDIYNIKFPTNYFDCIIMSEVLEHLSEEVKALKSLKRILKENGQILVTVPNKNFPFFWDPLNFFLMKIFNTHINKNLWWLAGVWADHEQLYTGDSIKMVVKKSGFIIEDIRTYISYSWPFTHFILYGIGKNIAERLSVSSVDRFSAKKKPLSELIAKIVSFPQRFESPKEKKRAVNLVLTLKKSKSN